MKRVIVGLSLLMSVGLFACKKPASVASDAPVQLRFNHIANGKPLVLDDALGYTSANNQVFSASMLKYYVGKVQLVKADGTTYDVAGYHLMNCDAGGKKTIDMAEVPNGTYTKVRFCLGVDKTSNATATIGGDLDVSNGMFWEMVGYTFFKHEGKYTNAAGNTDALVLHYGRNEGYIPQIDISLGSGLVVAGNRKVIDLNFSLDKVYSNGYDFNTYNFQMSSSDLELPWILVTKANLPGAFSFNSIN
jgi:hypothetical protein